MGTGYKVVGQFTFLCKSTSATLSEVGLWISLAKVFFYWQFHTPVPITNITSLSKLILLLLILPFHHTLCPQLFHHDSSSVPILMAVILVLVLALVALTKSSSRLHRIRLCKNRFILLTFVVLLLIYFLCYTSVWMRAFEFSGSIHKTVQEEKSDKLSNSDSFKDQNFLPS